MTALGGIALTSDVYTAAEVDALLAALGGGATTLVETQELGAAGIFDFQALPDPADFAHLYCIVEGRSALTGSNSENCYLRLNADSSNDYINQYHSASGGSGAHGNFTAAAGFIGNLPAADAPAIFRGCAEILIANYGDGSGRVTWTVLGGGAWTGQIQQVEIWGTHATLTAAITRLQIGGGATLTNLAAGSIASLYGLAR